MSLTYLYVRRPESWRDILVRAARASDAGHVGVQVGPDEIIDLSLSHECARWTRAEWDAMWRPVAAHVVPSVSDEAEQQAIDEARACVGRLRYDTDEWAGFIFWRQMGSKGRLVCSSFAQRIMEIHTHCAWPDNRGRIDPRHMMIATGMLSQALARKGTHDV